MLNEHKRPAGWGTTWGGSKQCVTSLGKKEERFQWNQHVSASALGGINKKTAEEKWWHRATGEFIYSCAFALLASCYNDNVKKGKTKKANVLTWLWVFDSASSPDYDETTLPDSSRERGNARATKDCKVKQEKLVRAPRLHYSGSAEQPNVRRLSVGEKHSVEEN